MRIFLLDFITLIIASLSFTGCNRQRTLSPHHWIAVGGEFDSLTNKIEWQFNDYSPYDSIDATIKRMEYLASIDSTHHDLKKSRALYWRSRFLWRLEKHDSSINVAKEALALNDSISYKYDRLRMLSLIYSQDDSISGAIQYKHFEECLNYAKRIGDIAFESYIAVQMGNLMNYIGENERALDYIHLTDSLNLILGYNKLIIKNQVNKARILSEMGKKHIGDSILKSLINHPLLDRDTFVMNVIPRNLYVGTNDIRYLYQANDQIKNIERFRFLRGLYSALLLKHNYLHDNYDSVFYYADIAYDNLPYVTDYNHKAIIWHSLSLAWTLTEHLDSAYICRLRYEHYIDSVNIQRSATEVLRLSALHEMGAREAEYRAADFRRNMIAAFIIFVHILISSILSF